MRAQRDRARRERVRKRNVARAGFARATWHPVRDLNPCYQDENLASWAARRTGQVSGCARGGGLEPPITGPEPAVLLITPPPNGCPCDAVAAAEWGVTVQL